MHWASEYIGRPHADDADGPARFSCWGLVRHVYRTRHGVELPHVAIGTHLEDEATAANVAAIKQAARLAQMRPLAPGARPVDDDVVVMRSVVRLHCGIVVTAGGRLGVLHAAHDVGVTWQPWRDAVAGMSTELWRRSQC